MSNKIPAADTREESRDRPAARVRGAAASSGGLTLISLAWYLALWEVAFEEGARAPACS